MKLWNSTHSPFNKNTGGPVRYSTDVVKNAKVPWIRRPKTSKLRWNKGVIETERCWKLSCRRTYARADPEIDGAD